MTSLLTCRQLPGGGPVAPVTAFSNPPSLSGSIESQIIAQCRGRDVLIATHGFNVNQLGGIDHLAEWETLLTLPDNAAYLGYLWPGDSVWLHALVFPEAVKIALQAGDTLAAWLNNNLTGAASLSFASHSLGARVVLQTIAGLNSAFRIRRVVFMAGAIDDTCLGQEYANAASRVEKISNLASSQDDVLKLAFPLGNPISGIFAEGHPFWKAALGREGPTKNPPAPAQFDLVCKIPDEWGYGHGNYLPPSPAPAGYQSLAYPLPVNCPAPAAPPAANTPSGYRDQNGDLQPFWTSAWSAGFLASRFP